MRKVLAPNANLVLIGMPGAGKSTTGILLAKILSKGFIDTDVVIQSQEDKSLQVLLDESGREGFCKLEETYVQTISPSNHVIATGGSVVYSDIAMRHLGKGSLIVHLDLPLNELEARLSNVLERGVVMEPGQTLATLYQEREPLYRKYADVVVDCSGLNHEEVVIKIVHTVVSW